MKIHRYSLFSSLAVFSLAVAFCLPAVLEAGVSPGGSSGKGGDSIGTAPLIGSQDLGSGFQVEMPLAFLSTFVHGTRGSGSFRIAALPESGRVRVTLVGRMSVRLSKFDVARVGLKIGYDGTPGASRLIQTRRTIVLAQR